MSFEFPGQYSVATTQVDETTTQHIIVTASGTMMLVQQYSGSIPDQMLEVMFDTMVEEPKALGYEIEKTDLNRAISNQGVLNGVRAHYKGGDDDVTIDITSTTTKDGGFLILTMIDEASSQDEIPIIEGFWKSVTLKE